jgi:hypothetical protein
MERMKTYRTKWFQCYRAGTWHGREVSTADLDALVQTHATLGQPVPLIIEHTSDNNSAPVKYAEGIVDGLKRSGKKLMCKAYNVSWFLKHCLENQLLIACSTEIIWNYHGRPTLSAVAFLGGRFPEVPSMGGVEFEEDPDDKAQYTATRHKVTRHGVEHGEVSYYAMRIASHDVELAEETEETSANPEKHNTTHHKGGDEMELTKEQIQEMITKAIKDATPGIIDKFKAGDEFQGLVTRNATLEAGLTQAQTVIAEQSVMTNLERCAAYAATIVTTDKKLPPAANEAGLVAFLASLDNKKVMKFGAKECTQLDCFKGIVATIPGQISLFGATPRAANEGASIDGAAAEFAKKYGIDPAIMQQSYASARDGNKLRIEDVRPIMAAAGK